jgi:hypothetical protein
MESTYRSAGRAAIASGVIGIIAFAFLITAVTTRTSVVVSQKGYFLFKAHDVGGIFQYLLIIPAAFALYQLSHKAPPGLSRSTLRLGVGAASCTALFLALGIFKILSDGLYSFPQGIFGIWLIIVNGRLSGKLSKGLRWFGLIVGLGLAILGTVEPGYAIFVDPVILQIPAVVPTTYPGTYANFLIHKIIWIGTFMGVIPLPIWSIMLGRRLFQKKIY